MERAIVGKHQGPLALTATVGQKCAYSTRLTPIAEIEVMGNSKAHRVYTLLYNCSTANLLVKSSWFSLFSLFMFFLDQLVEYFINNLTHTRPME